MAFHAAVATTKTQSVQANNRGRQAKEFSTGLRGLPQGVLRLSRGAQRPFAYYRILKQSVQRASVLPLTAKQAETMSLGRSFDKRYERKIYKPDETWWAKPQHYVQQTGKPAATNAAPPAPPPKGPAAKSGGGAVATAFSMASKLLFGDDDGDVFTPSYAFNFERAAADGDYWRERYAKMELTAG
jgi:hypothetical protein